MKKENKIANRPSFKVVAAIMLATVVVVNLCLCLIPRDFRTVDTTANDAYKLSDETQNILDSLNEEITVYVIDADGSDTRYEYFLEEVDRSEKIKVKWTKFEDVADKAKKLGVTEEAAGRYCVIVEGKDDSKYYDYYGVITLSNKNSSLVSYIESLNLKLPKLELSETEEITAITVENGVAKMNLRQFLYVGLSLAYSAKLSQNADYAAVYQSLWYVLLNNSEIVFGGEKMLCEAIDYVTVERYYLTGHGESDMKNTFLGQAVLPYMGLNYKTLDISSDNVIPENTSEIFIASPKTDISAQEMEKLTAYINDGGSLTLFTDGDCADMPNLMRLMGEYGMKLQEGTVNCLVEKKAEETEPETDSGAEAQSDVVGPMPDGVKEYTDKVNADINMSYKRLEALKVITDLVPVIEKGNNIVYGNDGNNVKNVKFTPMLTASQNCFVDKDPIGNCTFAVAAETPSGGNLLWFTGGSSFFGELSEDTSEQDMLDMTNNAKIIACVERIDLVKLPADKLHAEKYMTVTDTAYVLSVLIPLILVLIISAVGAILIYKRKKA